MNEENLVKNKSSQELVADFVKNLKAIEFEIDTLKEQQKELIESFKDKLDMKVLKAALRVAKIKSKVDAVDTFDNYLDIVERNL